MFPKNLKSVGTQTTSRRGLVGFFDSLGSSRTRLHHSLSILYYANCSPVATSIDLIAQEFSSLTPRLFNTKTGEFEKNQDHPVLQLLKTPNADSTYKEFATRLVSYFLITGESYSVATGPINRPPLEVWVPNVIDIDLSPDRGDGFLGSIILTGNQISEQFGRSTSKGRFRYTKKDETAEAWQVKNFNPLFSSSNLGGFSFLCPVVAEVEQFIESNTHNLSMLKRGARPSGIFSSPDALTDDQFERLQSQIDGWYSGASNAGRPLLVEGGTDYKDAMMTARDMDFLNLKRSNADAIFNQFHIPLPLVSPDQMTLANMETAKLTLYDTAVLPIADRIFEELTNFLMPRFPRSENLKITYNSAEIAALEIRRTEAAKIRKETGVNTTNEIRRTLGDEPIAEGETVMVPANLVPLGTAMTQPMGPTDRSGLELSDLPPRAQFFEILVSQKNTDGGRVYTDKQIEDFADAYKL